MRRNAAYGRKFSHLLVVTAATFAIGRIPALAGFGQPRPILAKPLQPSRRKNLWAIGVITVAHLLLYVPAVVHDFFGEYKA